MPDIILAVSEHKDALDLARRLAESGYGSRITVGAQETLYAAESAQAQGVNAVVLDSGLVGRAAAAEQRNLVQEIKSISKKACQRTRDTQPLPVVILMTRHWSDITNKLLKEAVDSSDAVIYAPVSPSDLRLQLGDLLTLRKGLG